MEVLGDGVELRNRISARRQFPRQAVPSSSPPPPPSNSLRYCAVRPTVLAGQIDPLLFEALYGKIHCRHLSIAIFLFGGIPEIWKNFFNKSTGELSFLTCFMSLGGSIVVLGSALGTVTDSTILSQIILHRNPETKKEKKVS